MIIKKCINIFKDPKTLLKLPLILYAAILIIICLNIFIYSYKAWFYPVRNSNYFDECSYIAMGKYFRTFPPDALVRDYILKKKPIPSLYNEFDSRMIYLSLLLSVPLSYTEDRTDLHVYRALFLALGTIVFFLLGHKLGGISGGVITAALWFGLPLLNYWGHFFMSENPSFIFIAAGYLFLLYSDRSGLSSILGGIFLGLAAFTRFTTIILIFPAPFILTAVYFNPFRREKFQLLGELGKTLAGFCLTALPYLVFIALIYENPLIPFQNAMYAVDRFPVNDPDYYLRNLWIEGGPWIKYGAMLAFISPFVYGFIWVFYQAYIFKKDRLTGKIAKDGMIAGCRTDDCTGFEKIKLGVLMSGIFKNRGIKFISVFIRGILYYGIITAAFIITASIYLYSLSGIVHKLPRYLMGALIPFVITAGIGFGMIERFLLALFKVIGVYWIAKIKKKDYSGKEEKIDYFFSSGKYAMTVCLVFVFTLCALMSFFISGKAWQGIVRRPYSEKYDIPEHVIKSIDDEVTLFRLQPEYLLWEKSLYDRLNDSRVSVFKRTDNDAYIGQDTADIINYLNAVCKNDEVLYVDRQSMIPLVPAYAEFPCMFITPTYGSSVDNLIRKEQLPYDGYVLIFSNDENDAFKTPEGKPYYRALSRQAVINDAKFFFIKSFKDYDVFYFNGKKKFPFKYGTRMKIANNYADSGVINPENDGQNRILNKNLFYSVTGLIEEYLIAGSKEK